MQKVLEKSLEMQAQDLSETTAIVHFRNGTGRFLPGENTNPFIGEPGRLEEVEEVRIETIVPEPLLKKTITAMIKAHPYEEVAYDVYPA